MLVTLELPVKADSPICVALWGISTFPLHVFPSNTIPLIITSGFFLRSSVIHGISFSASIINARDWILTILDGIITGIVKKCAVEENPKSEIDRYQAA